MKTIIEAKGKWWRIDWKELWGYRSLIFLFARRSLATMYKQSILGPLWFLIQPFLTALVFYVVFGLLMRIATGGMPHMIFYMSGMIFWYLFVNVFQQTSVSLMGNTHLYGKVYFPRLVMPLSYIMSGVVLFGLNFLTLMGFYFYYVLSGESLIIQKQIVLLPFMILQVCLAGLAFGLCIASASVRFRDVKFMLPTIIQFWMFMTPIFYSSSRIASPRLKLLMRLNPVYAPVEQFRYMLSGANSLGFEAFIPGLLLTLGVLMIGLFWFNYAQRSFIDMA